MTRAPIIVLASRVDTHSATLSLARSMQNGQFNRAHTHAYRLPIFITLQRDWLNSVLHSESRVITVIEQDDVWKWNKQRRPFEPLKSPTPLRFIDQNIEKWLAYRPQQKPVDDWNLSKETSI